MSGFFGPFGHLPKKRKLITRSEILEQTNEHPIDGDLPLPSQFSAWNSNDGGGAGFNIVKMIEDHVPSRITQIDDEMRTMQEKMNKLEIERAILKKLQEVIGSI